MNRVTARYAEQQVARLARELGVKMHYCHQGRDVVTITNNWDVKGLAEPAQYGTKGAWVLDSSAAGGWLNLYAYAEEGRGGLTSPLGHMTYKAAEWWEIAGAMSALLRFQREALESVAS